MGSINSLAYTAAVQNGTNSQQATSSTGSSALPDVDKSEFLKLLVAQLKNQDPLNPIDNQDFIAQLATFSSLEQLISINQAVTKLAGGSGTQQTVTGGTS
jgi:flagellar basal-body rod modification protein FlgD